jgi:SNF2 family DNA or RNA helicase
MWNPAKENQATDRAYRIGQTRNVYVYKPVATLPGENESLDERLDELISAKAELADEVIRPTKEMRVSTEELRSSL